VGALYSGISATVLGVAPYAGFKFASYEALKGVVGASFGLDESQLRPWQRVSAGALYSPSARADRWSWCRGQCRLGLTLRVFNAVFTARVSTRCEMPPVHGTADVLAP